MAVPTLISFDPLNLTTNGLVGSTYSSIDPDTLEINGVGLLTFGFVWGGLEEQWQRIDMPTTGWSAVAQASTSWTRVTL